MAEADESKAWSFGEVLRDFRERSRITRQGLAKTCGISVRSLEKLELGVYQPSWDTVVKLCRGLNVSPERFMPPAGEPEA